MRSGSALLLLTAALSTTSIAAPVVARPGPRSVSVEPHKVDLGIDASGLAGPPTSMPSDGGLQLLTPPRSVPTFATVPATWRDTSGESVAAASSLKFNPDGRPVAAGLPSGLGVRKAEFNLSSGSPGPPQAAAPGDGKVYLPAGETPKAGSVTDGQDVFAQPPTAPRPPHKDSDPSGREDLVAPGATATPGADAASQH